MQFQYLLAVLAVGVVVTASVSSSGSNGEGRYGVDVAFFHDAATFQCLRENYDVSFATVRAHHSWGGVDLNAPRTVAAAWAGGLTNVDVYLFPCSFGRSAAYQVNSTLAFLESENVTFGRVWLDIEWNFTPGCEWNSTDWRVNCDFLGQLVDAVVARGRMVGIYVGLAFWEQYMAMKCEIAKDYPLWYARYDNDPKNYNDFRPYGGWTAPNVKQFSGGWMNKTNNICNVDCDQDWSEHYPEGPYAKP
jgi:hypothetical protein